MNKVQKLPLFRILKDSAVYCINNVRFCGMFGLIFYILGAGAVMSWQSWLFLPLMVLLYIAWGVFFRIYFERRPYFKWKSLFGSLLPSTKIVLLTVIVASLFVLLPLIPLFINISPEFNANYTRFLQGDLEQNGVFMLITNILFLLISPIIAYRPFLAWISALIGRSGSLKHAWQRTTNNYINFLGISLITDFSLTILRTIIIELGGSDYITMIFAALLLVYFNVVSALTFEFFFLEKESKSKAGLA